MGRGSSGVEQGTENLCVGGSNPPRGTLISKNLIMDTLNWVLGILTLVSVIGLLVGFIGLFVSLLAEKTNEQKKFTKTKIFGIITAIAMVLLTISLVIWGLGTSLMNS